MEVAGGHSGKRMVAFIAYIHHRHHTCERNKGVYLVIQGMICFDIEKELSRVGRKLVSVKAEWSFAEP